MSKREFKSGAEVQLGVPVPAFPTSEEADRLDWTRRKNLPPGRYVVRSCGRSDAGPHDESHSHGLYYEIEGPGRGWVRQNYLLAGQHEDWPWDLTFCLEPLKWDEAWASYRRERGEPPSEPRESVEPPAGAPPEAAGAESADGGASPGVDEFGVPIADSGDFLPDFDSIFEMEENEDEP